MTPLPTPHRLLAQATELARLGIRVAAWGERQALAVLQSRLDLAAPVDPASGASSSAPVRGLHEKMESLLDRAIAQSTRSGQAELFHRILDQLVPDEARILGALSDGSASPLVHVRARTRTGTAGRPVLDNASLVGRTANLALPLLTDTYVGHLLALGLVESGPEDPSLKQDYEILMAESHVLRAMRSATRGPLGPIVDKHTLRLSSLGMSLWQATSGGHA